MHSVCARAGGFRHHTRFLLLLSENYNDVNLLNKKGFLIEKDLFPALAKDKVDFIKKYVYPDTRTCFNWNTYEQIFMIPLERVLSTHHTLSTVPVTKEKEYKTVFLHHEHLFTLDKYIKFGPNVILDHKNKGNGRSLYDVFESFLEFLDSTNHNFVPKDSHKILHIDGKLLYNELLDEAVYNRMVEFFNITNEYEHACEVHKTWYNLQVKAKKDCIDWVINSKYPDFPWKNFMYERKLKLSVEDFELVKNYLKKVYEVDC